jgi:hypothetical protein
MTNSPAVPYVRNKQPVYQDDAERTEVSQYEVQVRSQFDDEPSRSIE